MWPLVSLEAWSGEGKRGVWVKIPLSRAELVPVAAKVSISMSTSHNLLFTDPFISLSLSLSLSLKLGFEYHHAQSDYVMMTVWLPAHEESTIPLYATHNIGELVAEPCIINNGKKSCHMPSENMSLSIRHVIDSCYPCPPGLLYPSSHPTLSPHTLKCWHKCSLPHVQCKHSFCIILWWGRRPVAMIVWCTFVTEVQILGAICQYREHEMLCIVYSSRMVVIISGGEWACQFTAAG